MRLTPFLPVLALCCGVACTPTPVPWRDAVKTWKPDQPLPSFPLVDQAARPFPLADLKGRPLVVGFVFTHCTVADACPMTMSRLQQVQELGAVLHREGADMPRILVVTMDPERDTPAVLTEYGRKFKVDFTGFTLATGDKPVVDALASLFNVVAIKQGDTLTHPVKAALLDDKLVVVHEWTDNNFQPKEVLDAVHPQ